MEDIYQDNNELSFEAKYNRFMIKVLFILCLFLSAISLVFKFQQEFHISVFTLLLLGIFICYLSRFFGILLVITLIFNLMQITLFFLLRLHNHLLKIEEKDFPNGKIVPKFIINSLFFLVFAFLLYYSYALVEEIVNPKRYSDTTTFESEQELMQGNSYADLEDKENRNENENNYSDDETNFRNTHCFTPTKENKLTEVYNINTEY